MRGVSAPVLRNEETTSYNLPGCVSGRRRRRKKRGVFSARNFSSFSLFFSVSAVVATSSLLNLSFSSSPAILV